MTISGIAIDKFAASGGIPLQYTTITIVTICFLLSFSLFCIRLQQILTNKEETDEKTFFHKMLQICHLLAMFFSCFYIFLYEWNYLHLYLPENTMHCSTWFVLIMISITFSKVFLYSFLMLRSSLSFRNSMFQIPLLLSITITTLSVSSQLTMMSLMLSDFDTFTPFPDKSLCFRTLGTTATAGITGFNVSDAISNAIALFIFWRKSKSVKRLLFAGPTITNNTVNRSKSEISDIFQKHIFLGMLITAGSILIFFAGEFLTILMGVASVLHQLANNIYIFLMFRENQKIYMALCCKCCTMRLRHIENKLNAIEIQVHSGSTKNVMNIARIKRVVTNSGSPSKSLSALPRTVTSIVYRKNGEKDAKSQSLINVYEYEDKPSNFRNKLKKDKNNVDIEENQRRSTILKLNINTNQL
eukprot:2388_1